VLTPSANIVFAFAGAHTEVPPMVKAFFLSKEWMWRAYGGATLILGLLFAQIKIAVMVNEANKRLYDVLPDAAHHSLSDFYGAIFQILWIGGPTVLIGTIAVYITRKYAFWWREAITFYYIPLWRNVVADIEGASQRIQEDVYRGTKVMEGIGWQIASAIFILVGFVPILWELSRGVQVSVLSAIPGSLVWVAFAVSFGGLGISWLVGSKLPALEYDNQRVEAAFRKELVYGEDDKKTYASEAVLRTQFNDIRANSNRLFLHSAYFDLWKYAYSHTVWIVPFLALSSGLFYGLLTFGVMMQVVDAFSRVNNSLGQFIHNWGMITEVRSICRRLREFQRNLAAHQATDKPAHVAYRASGPEKMDNILVLPVQAKFN
jgi:peptide/bleomycin uptake transporter